jgi:serine/threonine-protein kinase
MTINSATTTNDDTGPRRASAPPARPLRELPQTAALAPPDAEPNTVGPFEIEAPLSQGGMARIFLAHHRRRPTIRVVVKIPRAANGDRNFDDNMWQEEAQRLNELRHPNIVRICPFETENREVTLVSRALNLSGQPMYYVMEYVAGSSLKDAFRVIREFPIGWRLELFYQVLVTIHFMHTLGWAHCDLKPGNILFRAPPSENTLPRAVLIDFGTLSPVNRLNHRVGTVSYAAPEMIDAIRRPDVRPDFVTPRRADIWSLGALLFEIVSGRSLVNVSDIERAKTSTIAGKFDDLRDIEPKAPASLSGLVKLMTAKDPTQRPQTGEIIQIIERDVRFPPFFQAIA